MADTAFDLRPAVEADYEAVEALARQLYQIREQAHPDVFALSETAVIEEADWQEFISGSDHLVLVADMNGVVTGFVHAISHSVDASPRYVSRDYASIEMMAVDQSQRRSGIGRSLVRSVQDWASERELTSIELEVHDANLDAKGLYDALGFRSVKRTMSIVVR